MPTPTVTALLTVYRRPYTLGRQLEALRAQSVCPAEVWAFAQEPSESTAHQIQLLELDRTIVCDPNSHYHLRFAFALSAQTDFVVILDDDAIPGRRWLENCLETFVRTPGILGTHGVRYRGFHRYTDRTLHGWPEPSPETVEVDYVGQVWFLPPAWIRHLFAEPLATGRNGEDIELGARAWRLAGIRSFACPHPPGEPDWWGSIDPTINRDTAASCRRPGFVNERLKILHAELRAGWQPLCRRGVDSRWR